MGFLIFDQELNLPANLMSFTLRDELLLTELRLYDD